MPHRDVRTPGQPTKGGPVGRSTRARLARHRGARRPSVDDLAAVTALVERLGGARLADHEEEDFHWRVMRDPEGNEFCLMPSGQDG
ncbi:MAG: VOC family protein [Actinomycetota bacterium]